MSWGVIRGGQQENGGDIHNRGDERYRDIFTNNQFHSAIRTLLDRSLLETPEDHDVHVSALPEAAASLERKIVPRLREGPQG